MDTENDLKYCKTLQDDSEKAVLTDNAAVSSDYFKEELETDNEEDSKEITPIITMTEPVSFDIVDIKVEQDFEKDFINGSPHADPLQVPELKYSCNACDFSTNWKKNLRRHKKRMHVEANSGNNASPLVLSSNVSVDKKENEHLNSGYGAKRYLFIHKRKIHNIGKKNFLCDQCDYVTGSTTQLKIHIGIKHLGKTKTYPCTLCDHVAYYTQSLADHVRRVHSNKRYPCDACDKEFMSNEGLRNHQDSAHNDSSYPCSQCESILKNRSALRNHIRIKHESPMMQCEFCDYSTQNKTNMKCHTVHKHGDEKFKCKLCRYDTIKAEYLERHMKEKHLVGE